MIISTAKPPAISPMIIIKAMWKKGSRFHTDTRKAAVPGSRNRAILSPAAGPKGSHAASTMDTQPTAAGSRPAHRAVMLSRAGPVTSDGTIT